MTRQLITLTVTEYETLRDQLNNALEALSTGNQQNAIDYTTSARDYLADVADECGYRTS